MSNYLSVKSAISTAVELMNLQAQRDHNLITSAQSQLQTALNSVDTRTSITFGEFIGGFEADTITAFRAAPNTTDLTTYNSDSVLTVKEATLLAIEIAGFQAEQTHDQLNQLIDSVSSNAAITDNELLGLFSSEIQIQYKTSHTDIYNFTSEPQAIVDILTANETYSAQFTGFTANLDAENNSVTLSKDGADSVTFNLVADSNSRLTIANSSTLSVNYVSRTVSAL